MGTVRPAEKKAMKSYAGHVFVLTAVNGQAGERPAVEVVAAARDFDGRVPIPHPMVAYQRRRAGLWDR